MITEAVHSDPGATVRRAARPGDGGWEPGQAVVQLRQLDAGQAGRGQSGVRPPDSGHQPLRHPRTLGPQRLPGGGAEEGQAPPPLNGGQVIV